MTLLLIFFFAGLLAWLLTALLRRYALARSLLDIPNARSSHILPTPRGGGVAIVLTFFIGLPLLQLAGVEISTGLLWALYGAGAGVALLGFLDDHGHIPARWRLLGHFVAAIWVLFWLGGIPPMVFLGMPLDFGWLGHLLALFYLVWLLNLYNFMDGIDGIASVEAISATLGGILMLVLVGQPEQVWSLLLLALAVAGFLLWNFPPAKIFMGDAGSGFLGVVLGIFSLHSAWSAPQLFWGWLILLGVFVVDASVTLLRRLLRREKVYEAHRSHAYQYAARQFGQHLPVTVAVVLINFCGLLPLALVVALGWLDGLIGLLLAYVPLLWLAVRFRAGDREQSSETVLEARK